MPRIVGGSLLALLTLSACGPEVEGFAWDVRLTDALDECNDPPVEYDETFTYVMRFQGAEVAVGIDDTAFAAGTIAGCNLSYESVTWEEIRDGHTIRWRIEGEALWRQGGGACNLDEGVDWLGTETVVIVASEHPDVPTGCRYTMDATGSYVGEF